VTLSLSLTLFSAPLVTEAQPVRRIHRIGMLVYGPPPGEHACVVALRKGFSDLGYVEGRTHTLEIRWTEERPEKSFPLLGAELVQFGSRSI
jgi:hypothetical protein